MSDITTHVLDISVGRPAANVSVTLEAQTASGAWTTLANGATDKDGRLKDLSAAKPTQAGMHRLLFDTGGYFASRNISTLYPQVIIVFEISDPHAHYHIPLLLSPYGYSTYRGS